MPHLVIEYSANLAAGLSPARLLTAANAALVASGEFEHPDHIKSRALSCPDFRVGEAESGEAFAHARLHLLSGRSIETKRALCAALTDAIAAALVVPPGLRLQVTAEAIDMARESYSKVILGS